MDDSQDAFVDSVRGYYRSLDSHEYDRLRAILHPEFVHHRPDIIIEGRDDFVDFMREGRPITNSIHDLEVWFVPEAEPGDAPATSPSSEPAPKVPPNLSGTHHRIAIQGRLRTTSDDHLLDFVDIHTRSSPSDHRIRTIQTYTA